MTARVRSRDGGLEMSEYDAFLDAKRVESRPSGFTPDGICPMLFDFQRDIVTWACKRGKSAIFADPCTTRCVGVGCEMRDVNRSALEAHVLLGHIHHGTEHLGRLATPPCLFRTVLHVSWEAI